MEKGANGGKAIMNAFITTACKKYIPDMNAFLNSLDWVGNTDDVHLWYYQFPEWYLDKLRGASFTFPLALHEVSEKEAREYGGESEIMLRKRYWYAAEVGKDYDAVCVVDADTTWVRNPTNFFRIAAMSDVILGIVKEQCKVYNDPHDRARGEFLIDPTIMNDADICAAPLFVNAKTHEGWLKRSWDIFCDGYPTENFKSNDMDAINICIKEAGFHDLVVKLPNVQFLGTNESLLKPYTRACNRNGLLWNQNGGQIFSIHGQFYKKNWRDNQLANRHRCAMGYLGCSEKSDDMAKEALETMYQWWDMMCHHHKIDIPRKNYINPDLPEE